jgi:hypothetical protein
MRRRYRGVLELAGTGPDHLRRYLNQTYHGTAYISQRDQSMNGAIGLANRDLAHIERQRRLMPVSLPLRGQEIIEVHSVELGGRAPTCRGTLFNTDETKTTS